MAKLEVLKFPDPRLRQVAKPVDEVTPELAQLAQDMLETMYDHRGIGLAAIQVGQPVRLLVIDTRPRDSEGRYDVEEFTEKEKAVSCPIVIFNPEIVVKEGQTTFQEGCLSVPSYFETVDRFESIEVKGLNEKNEEIYLKLDGLMSICMQHEIDHLDGKLFIDRLSLIKANKLKNKIKKFGYPEMEDDDAEEVKEPQELSD